MLCDGRTQMIVQCRTLAAYLGYLLSVQVDGDQMIPKDRRTKRSDVRSVVAPVSCESRGDAGTQT
jgi:hypothetical protein